MVDSPQVLSSDPSKPLLCPSLACTSGGANFRGNQPPEEWAIRSTFLPSSNAAAEVQARFQHLLHLAVILGRRRAAEIRLVDVADVQHAEVSRRRLGPTYIDTFGVEGIENWGIRYRGMV